MPQQLQLQSKPRHVFEAKATKKSIDIALYGIIGDWWEDSDASYVRTAIESADTTLPINVHLGSLGGNPDDAQKIGNYLGFLLEQGREVSLYIVANTASAATMIVSIATVLGVRVYISKYANYLVHEIKSSSSYFMSAADHDAAAADLRTMNDNFINLYVDTCLVNGKSTTAADIEQLMKKDAWITAEKAVELGLVREIIQPTQFFLASFNANQEYLNYSDNQLPTIPKEMQYSANTPPPVTQSPVTEPPVTQPPVTQPPVEPHTTDEPIDISFTEQQIDELVAKVMKAINVGIQQPPPTSREHKPPPPSSPPTMHGAYMGNALNPQYNNARPASLVQINREFANTAPPELRAYSGAGFQKPVNDIRYLNEIEKRFLVDVHQHSFAACGCSGSPYDNPVDNMDWSSFQQELKGCMPAFVRSIFNRCRKSIPEYLGIIDNVEPNRIYMSFQLSLNTALKAWACQCCPDGELNTRKAQYSAYALMSDVKICPGDIYLNYYNLLQQGGFMPYQLPFADWLLGSIAENAVGLFLKDGLWHGKKDGTVPVCNSTALNSVDGFHYHIDNIIASGSLQVSPTETSHYELPEPFTAANTYGMINDYVEWLALLWNKVSCHWKHAPILIVVPFPVFRWYVRNENALLAAKTSCCDKKPIDFGEQSMSFADLGYSNIWLVADEYMHDTSNPNTLNRIVAAPRGNLNLLINTKVSGKSLKVTDGCRNFVVSTDYVYGTGIENPFGDMFSVATLPGEAAYVHPPSV